MTTHVDPITLELIKGMMRSARAEMEALIERTAMSPFIREKKDYFTAFFTRDGRMLFGTNLPLGGNLLDAILAQYPAETMRPGDLYWYNDCYGTCGGVSHSPDMVFVAPVFYDHHLVGFAEAWGHLWDIGGMMPGSISPAATEVYHEGIIMPPIRIYREGVLNDEVFRIFARNSRFPDILKGDLRAILASCRLGKQRLEGIFARFGTDTTLAAFEQVIRQSTAAVRQAFETRVPDGSYSFRDYLDSDGITDQSYAVHLTLVKKNGTISLDFSETDDQARGAVNFIMHDSVLKFMYGLYLTAGDPTILLNHGFAQAIDEVKTRPGSLVNPIAPAPLGMRSNTMLRVNNCVFGTLALATDGQTNAASSVYVIYMLRSLNRQSGDYTLCIEGLGVGFGARPFADGPDAIYYVAQKNYPVEFAEMEFGVRIERYSMHPDSGGPGRYRGGCGIVRDVRIIADEGILASRLENVTFPAWGVNGGHSGRPGRIVVNPDTPEERELKPLSDNNRLRQGDLLRVMTSGGGGWGHPFDRPAARVLEDVLDGFVSPESALKDYGVVLDPQTLAVDEVETSKIRTDHRSEMAMFHRDKYLHA
ncbi:MAG TPA: hydantoinase B/oxoprolinase family protein [Candidatus Saccharimonadia bacterium]|nr:hydantoinase B/oxoprolinase family protein [Candidatus Saccharimonadia bacterium]